jgi:ribosomal protein S18 acetylase RimI-like enzyme
VNITIRKAERKDCLNMMELIHELAIYEKAADEVVVDFNHFVESGFGETPVWWAFVAEITHLNGNTEIAGFALYYIRYSTWKGQRLYLEDIIVKENFRGNGIGNLLMEQLMTVCRQKNFSGMNWQVLDWNEPAINFYKKYQNTQFDAGWINVSLAP